MENRGSVDEVKKFLIPYLRDQGIDLKPQYFRCFSGKHADTSPSCHIIPASRGTRYFCFGCQESGDIFTAAHLLERMPRTTQDFWNLTVATLCSRYGIPYEPAKMTAEDKLRYKLYSLAQDVSSYVLGSLERKDSPIHQALLARGWTTDTARSVGIGCVESYDNYIGYLHDKGWSDNDIAVAGFADSRVFGPGSQYIFVIADAEGRPVAFAARMTNPDAAGTKYINTANTPIYIKKSVFYMLDKALESDGPLWIVEGYADAITLWQAGVRRVVALGSNRFTGADDEVEVAHTDILLDNKITNVVLALDNDDGGNMGISAALSKHFPKVHGVMVRVCQVPAGEDDPDNFVRTHGAKAFLELPRLTPFEWELNRIKDDGNNQEIIENMTPIIADESDPVTRWDMARALSVKTGVPAMVISDKVRIKTHGGSEVRSKAIEVIRGLAHRLSAVSEPDVAQGLVQDYGSQLDTILARTNVRLVDFADRVASVRNMTLEGKTPRLKLGKFKMIENALTGLPSAGCLIALVGEANIGKTSFVREFTFEIMRCNKDARVLFFSYDDSFSDVLNGYIALMTDIPKDVLQSYEHLSQTPNRKQVVWEAYDELAAKKGQLDILDVVNGNSIKSVEHYLDQSMERYQDMNHVIVIDSFHDLADTKVGDGGEGIIAGTSTRLKRLSIERNIPIIINVHANRNNSSFPRWRTTLGNIKGSGSIEYNCNLGLVMHQKMHREKGATKLVWSDGPGTDLQPINELEFAKNKLSGFKGSIYLKFHQRKSRFEEMPENKIIPILREEELRIANATRRLSEYKPKNRHDQDDNEAEDRASDASGSRD